MSESILKEYIRLVIEGKTVSYIGVVLDKTSRQMLLDKIPPQHENITAGHVTLVHEPTPEEMDLFAEGEPVTVRVAALASDENAQAAIVILPQYYRDNATRRPHITISTAQGVQQLYSNELIEREAQVISPFVLMGHIKFV